MDSLKILAAFFLLYACPTGAVAQEKWNDDCAQPAKYPLLTSGCAALDDFMMSFNTGNASEWAKSLNYPHVRIAAGETLVFNTQREIVATTDFSQFAVENRGWTHSAWDWRRLVQKSPDKLHFLVQFSRYGEANKKIASYESLYVVTLKDGHWGVQARSSYAGIAAGKGAPL